MEYGVREFPLRHNGFSPQLTPARHCSHLLTTFYITFSLYFEQMLVGHHSFHYSH